MGLPDDYILPDNYTEACHLTGDGVVVPAVRFLADALIESRGLAQSRRGEADSPGKQADVSELELLGIMASSTSLRVSTKPGQVQSR